MLKTTVSFLFIFSMVFQTRAQYTETINSNRPGESQGAFAVGKNVLQLEAGAYMGNDNHSLFYTDTDILGASYGLRFGFLTEILELNFFGSFQQEKSLLSRGVIEEEYERANFKQNTIGAKFLLFDPHRSLEEDKPNLYSWKANQGFKWKTLIPAVSVYAGANFSWWDNPYMFQGESGISPKAAIITQNNWGRWVLVINLIADKFTEEFPTYAGIVTLTHAVTPKFAVFGEYQGLISDIYADDLFRGGAAYLFGNDFQLDISAMVNVKDTPSRWQVAAGISYRMDMHKDEEYIEEEGESRWRYEEGEFIEKEQNNEIDQGN
ncbi:MAG TPA: transporter [Salegentibacter sp.]|uniref:transporter n=1 Tax=Salegentibacter sp. TaxID=1903072 RepID=UPI002F94AB87